MFLSTVQLVTLVNPGQSRLNEKVVTFAVKNPFQHPIVGLILDLCTDWGFFLLATDPNLNYHHSKTWIKIGQIGP